MSNQPDEPQSQFLSRLGLFLARIAISAWIGAASLFVIVGVTEVTRGGFDTSTKDTLVALRFPAYYVFGFTSVGIAWIGIWLTFRSQLLASRRRTTALILLAIVLAVMTVDYLWIYQPLVQMVTPPGQVKPASFANYHEASKRINLAGLAGCLAVAWLVNWPRKECSQAPTSKSAWK